MHDIVPMGGSGSKRDLDKRQTNLDPKVDPKAANNLAHSTSPGFNCLKISATSIDDFVVATTLGKGSFGRVRLAKHKESSTLWALKILKKKEILHHNAIEHVYREKKILAALSHPFIVYMAVAFDDSHYVYFVLEFVQGGPFDTRLRSEGLLKDDASAFYTAQIVHIFEYMHAKDYIYRDLKPDNLILDMTGYIKLADFGFAVYCTTQTNTFCGTPDYLAPEIIEKNGYGKGVDWWALGIVLCEMLSGKTPFVADDPMETYKRILKNSPRWPSALEGAGKAAVRRYLVKKPTERMGNGKKGVEDCKKNRF
mmetsp:Transcript_23359/g.69975  ORF Transcript_23359/g.69975 Transcript_23359/m.69975 type:complete len:310 (+) Transcript_23359:1-930(+)